MHARCPQTLSHLPCRAKNGEIFVLTARAARNMCFQDLTPENGVAEKLLDLTGEDLLGLPLRVSVLIGVECGVRSDGTCSVMWRPAFSPLNLNPCFPPHRARGRRTSGSTCCPSSPSRWTRWGARMGECGDPSGDPACGQASIRVWDVMVVCA